MEGSAIGQKEDHILKAPARKRKKIDISSED